MAGRAIGDPRVADFRGAFAANHQVCVFTMARDAGGYLERVDGVGNHRRRSVVCAKGFPAFDGRAEFRRIRSFQPDGGAAARGRSARVKCQSRLESHSVLAISLYLGAVGISSMGASAATSCVRRNRELVAGRLPFGLAHAHEESGDGQHADRQKDHGERFAVLAEVAFDVVAVHGRLGFANPGGALLVVRLFGNRTVGIERDVVDQALFIEEGNEQGAFGRSPAAVEPGGESDFATAGGNDDVVAVSESLPPRHHPGGLRSSCSASPR